MIHKYIKEGNKKRKIMEERKTSEEQFKYKRVAGIVISVVFAVFGFVVSLVGLLCRMWIFAVVSLAVGVCFSVIAALASKRGKKDNNEIEESETQLEEEYLTADEQPTVAYKNTAKESKVVTDLKKVYKHLQVRIMGNAIGGVIAAVICFCVGIITGFVVFTAVAPLFIVFALISFFVYMYYEDKINEAGKEDKKFKATKKYKITKRYKVQSANEQSEETQSTKAK